MYLPSIVCWVNFFFQFHPFTIDFCIKFYPHSFNYSLSGFESFINGFFFNFIPLHLVSILDLILIILIVMYLVLNPLLNWFVFKFHHLTFYFYIKYDPYFFIVIFSCSYPFLDLNCFSIASLMIDFILFLCQI